MSPFRIRSPNALTPLHVVLVGLLTATVLGGFLFLSAAESKTLVDGAREWNEASPLRAVVQLLCLRYSFPTIHAGAVKMYLLGLGAGVALIAMGIAYATQSREEWTEQLADSDGDSRSTDFSSVDTTGRVATIFASRTPSLPLTPAQTVVVLYLLWSFASSRWSAAPNLAVGASVLLAISFLWSFILGRGLHAPAARIGGLVIVIVTSLTAAVAVWYFYGRNPTLRAKFPFGNPNFLSACLLPGILLAVSFLCAAFHKSAWMKPARQWLILVTAAATVVMAGWAMVLADSRGPNAGLLVGAVAMCFFALRGLWKAIPVLIACVIVVVAAGYFISLRDKPERQARSSTIRARLYAWEYAWNLFREKPLHGHGQGGFVLRGDAFAANDVLRDPQALNVRIAHAHSEWLETLADLGLVGLGLMITVLILTIREGVVALRRGPPPLKRWLLIGLLGSLIALCVEETFSVGLRVSGVPLAFYTVLGLTWAVSQPPQTAPHMFSVTQNRRRTAGSVGCVVGLAIVVMVQQDFLCARYTYKAKSAVEQGEVDEALHYATLAKSRLNPQRALTDQYRLAEAHMLVARKLQERAVERESRVQEGDAPAQNVLKLADQDRRRSDADCIYGSAELKKLIEWSPNFFNHGRVEYWLNRIMADNAAARNDREAESLALQNAAVAVRREMRRQPYDPSLATDYLDATIGQLSLRDSLAILAPPLRHHSLTVPYVQALARLSSDRRFDDEIAPLLEHARRASRMIIKDGPPPFEDEAWGPETLRLAAVVHFRRGDYAEATDTLALAAAAYDNLADAAPIGAASCYQELAICRFYSKPDDPLPAITSAKNAIRLAPASLPGRQIRARIENELVEYELAAGHEQEAVKLLRAMEVHRDAIAGELASRYRNLYKNLLGRRLAVVLRQAPGALVPKLHRWLDRAIELAPRDPQGYYLAADLASYTDDYETAAKQLETALNMGLAPEVAAQFLQVARERKPDHPALEALWQRLTGRPNGPPPPASASRDSVNDTKP